VYSSNAADGKWKLSPSKRNELDEFMIVSRRSNQALEDRIMLARKRNNNIVLRVVKMLDKGELDFEETTLVERERIDAEVVLKSCIIDLEKVMMDMENVSIISIA
jgi:hypothetical protein